MRTSPALLGLAVAACGARSSPPPPAATIELVVEALAPREVDASPVSRFRVLVTGEDGTVVRAVDVGEAGVDAESCERTDVEEVEGLGPQAVIACSGVHTAFRIAIARSERLLVVYTQLEEEASVAGAAPGDASGEWAPVASVELPPDTTFEVAGDPRIVR